MHARTTEATASTSRAARPRPRPALAPGPSLSHCHYDGQSRRTEPEAAPMTRPTVVVYDQLDYLDWQYDIEAGASLAPAGVRLVVPARAEAADALPCLGRHRPRRAIRRRRDGPDRAAGRPRVLFGGHGPGRRRSRPRRPASRSATCPTGRRRSSPSTASRCCSPRCAGCRYRTRAARTTRWDHRKLIADLGIELFSLQTVGVIGAGRIGQAFATRARALGFRTIAY